MTIDERENAYKFDIKKRKEIINNVLMIGIETIDNIKHCTNAATTQDYFQKQYNNYLGNMLTQEKYKPSDFWFNDAGLQFKWRNFENNIILECLEWKDVCKLVKQF